jgi:AbrB family looped-hinge helix DNA binding protein
LITQIREKSQLTIPKEILNALNLKKGDHIEVGVENGSIVLKPVLVIPRDQAWFYTEEWQHGERKADADIKRGRVTKELDAGETKAHLDSLKKKQR